MKQKFLSKWNGISPNAQRALIAFCAALIVIAAFSGTALAARMRAAILCDGGEPNCVEAWNGAGIIVYSDSGTTQKFRVNGSTGAVTGFVLQYPTPGTKEVCATGNITASTVLAHGLATPQYVNITMAQDATGDGARITFTNAAGVVTAKGWNSALTPAAATTPIAASWCIIGTP